MGRERCIRNFAASPLYSFFSSDLKSRVIFVGRITKRKQSELFLHPWRTLTTVETSTEPTDWILLQGVRGGVRAGPGQRATKQNDKEGRKYISVRAIRADEYCQHTPAFTIHCGNVAGIKSSLFHGGPSRRTVILATERRPGTTMTVRTSRSGEYLRRTVYTASAPLERGGENLVAIRRSRGRDRSRNKNI